jgi:hypothetical protein
MFGNTDRVIENLDEGDSGQFFSRGASGGDFQISKPNRCNNQEHYE